MVTRYVQGRELMEAPFGAEIVALDRAKGQCLSFNDVAADVWRKIATPSSIEEIVATLLQDYDVDESDCRKEVRQLLTEMENSGLARIIPGDVPDADVIGNLGEER